MPLTKPPLVASVTIDKSSNATSSTGAGSTITYSYLVKNTGAVPLTGVVVTDQHDGLNPAGLSDVSCPASTLAIGASMTCTATYEVVQADVVYGSVFNRGRVDTDQTEMVEDVLLVSFTKSADIALDKSSDATAETVAGSTITYSYLVTNTGTLPLTGITVTDSHQGLNPAGLSEIGCPSANLAPAASMTCTATYGVVQADVDAGKIVNTGRADSDQTGPVEDQLTVTLTGATELTIVKSSDATEETGAGDTITYSYLVTNTGDVTLTGVTVSDEHAGLNPDGLSAVTCPSSSLAPGASMSCTATYEVVQADVDAGSIGNVGRVVSEQSEPAEDDLTVTLSRAASVSIDKTSNATEATKAGDTITYSYLVTNTGDVTLTGLVVTDEHGGLNPAGLSSIDCPASALAPGASMTCTATYLVVQADVDAGTLSNTGRVDSDQTEPQEDELTVSLNGSSVAVEERSLGSIPQEYGLDPNYPNPFNPATTLRFHLPEDAKVTLAVYDVFGRVVETLASRAYRAGSYEVRWNAESVPSGVYFFRVHAGEFQQVRQMVLLK